MKIAVPQGRFVELGGSVGLEVGAVWPGVQEPHHLYPRVEDLTGTLPAARRSRCDGLTVDHLDVQHLGERQAFAVPSCLADGICLRVDTDLSAIPTTLR